jgi:hypothetical protein
MAVVPTALPPLDQSPVYRVVGLCRRFDGRRWSLEVPEYEYFDGGYEDLDADDTGETDMRVRSRSRD